jgi:hypothetical protein
MDSGSIPTLAELEQRFDSRQVDIDLAADEPLTAQGEFHQHSLAPYDALLAPTSPEVH